jgi:hypothetical protein
MPVQLSDDARQALVRRVRSEFIEMPGLRLTQSQAQRLWGLDEATCLELLSLLVDEKFLCHKAHGMYVRLTDGPPLRMAKVALAPSAPSVEKHRRRAL